MLCGAKPGCLVIPCGIRLFLIVLTARSVYSQPALSVQSEPNPTWAGRRIVTLAGFGDYFATGPDGQAHAVKPEGPGVNIVAVVQRVEGDRIWIKSNGSGDEPVGWVNKGNAILLENAIPYFTSRIESSPQD